jgi:MFS family permease
MAIVVLTLKTTRMAPAATKSMLHDLTEGLRFIRGNFIFQFLIGMTFFNSLFGSAAFQLMPVFARDVLDVGASGLGFLLSASAVGSIAGVLIIGSLSQFERKGLLVVGGATAYGLSLLFFASSTVFVMSAVAIALVGLFHQLYMVAVQTTLHMRVPDELRGRVMGVYGMTYNLGPLGALQAGAVAAAFSAPIAVAVGGIAIISFGLGVALSTREVRQLQATATPA